MKLLKSNGKILEVRDVGPVIYEVVPGLPGIPLKLNGFTIYDEDEAREVLRKLLSSGIYVGRKVDGVGTPE